jgi:hypothetical protein
MRSSLRFLVALALTAVPLAAHADWPTWRHDARRTAIAAGATTITKPTRYWQYYVGGTLRSNTHIAIDVDKDGVTDVVYLAGGKAIAKLPDDRLVWESPPVELNTLHGIVDLDGDGVNEVVASSSRNVYVISGVTGAVLWKQADGEVGNVGGVRIGDVDGDKRPDLIIDECSCCGITATASPPGGVYHFDAGKLGTPTKLYAPSTRGHCGSSAVTVLDVEGDGTMEVAYGTPDGYLLTNGKDGVERATATGLGEQIYYSSCEPANVDGRPGDELICFQNSYIESSSSGGHRVVVLTYDETATPKFKTLWNASPVPKATGQMIHVGSSLSDLDGDGRAELVVSWSSDGSTYGTSIYDARSGTVLGTIDGERIASVVDLDGDKKPEILTLFGTGVRARKFERGGTPAITTFATVPDVQVAWQYDLEKAKRGANPNAPLTIDLKGDGKSLPIFLVPATSGAKAKYVAYRFDAMGAATAAATYEFPDGVSILTTQVYPKVNRTYPQLLLTRNDGYLLVLDDAFVATNSGTYGTGEFKVVLPGMRVGGFLGAPIAPRLDGTTDAIVVTDSRGTLVRLDASAAWMAKAPAVMWEQRGANSPTTAPAIDTGKPGIVCNRNTTLTALSASGTKLWDRSLGGAMSGDALAGDVNGDGAADIFTAYSTTGAVLNLQVHDGKTGAPIWSAPHSTALSWGWQPFAVADHNGDGVADLYAVPNTVRVLNGSNGSKLAENTTFLAYFTPVIDDVDGDGVSEVTLNRGYFPARTWKKDLTTQLWIGGDDRPYQSGARAACSAGRSVWVQPSLQYPGLVRLVTMNGTGAGTIASVWLGGGALFASSADAIASGKFIGTLGDVAIKSDLLGTGAHPEALIGSSDGNLYALDPCAGKLDWALDMRFAVGDPILADTNGDGKDEILVPAADGYLHAVGERSLDRPAEVQDTEPLMPASTVDIDEVATSDRLATSWNAVVGADGYQVAVLTEGGSYVTQPDWVNVGAETNAVIKPLSLLVGKKYFVSVRAISKTAGSSLETKSDGVIVRAPPMVDGGLGDATLFEDTGVDLDGGADAGAANADAPKDEGGCGCHTPASRSSAGAVAGLFVALALLRRRR